MVWRKDVGVARKSIRGTQAGWPSEGIPLGIWPAV